MCKCCQWLCYQHKFSSSAAYFRQVIIHSRYVCCVRVDLNIITFSHHFNELHNISKMNNILLMFSNLFD